MVFINKNTMRGYFGLGQLSAAVAIGYQAGQTNQGSAAVAIGYGAGSNSSGSNNIIIGVNIDNAVLGNNGQLNIGNIIFLFLVTV